MTSKEYAETHGIPFDYIENWNKENSGADITAPTVEKIQVTYESVMHYNKDANKNMYMVPAGAKLVINVNFSEIVEGTAVPTLTIKFGDGQNIKVTEGTVGGSTITYIYTVQNTDKGVMSTIDLLGGNVKDAAGNAATLTCPAVSIQYNSGDFVYANGTATNPDNGDNNNGGNGNQQTVTLLSIAIATAPTRNTYTEGASFEKTGMVITAKYSDGTTKQITNYIVSPSGTLKTTDTKVVISYTENGVTKTVEQKITVISKTTSGNENNNGNNNPNNGNTNTPPEKEEKDPTIKEDNKLPQTGATVMIFAVIALIVVAVISKVKCVKYKDV